MATTVLPPSTGTPRNVRSARAAPVVVAEGERAVVVLSGEWDIARRPVLADVLSRVISSGTGDVVVDLGGWCKAGTSGLTVAGLGRLELERFGLKRGLGANRD